MKDQQKPFITSEERKSVRSSFDAWRSRVGEELGIANWEQKRNAVQLSIRDGGTCQPFWGKKNQLAKLVKIDPAMIGRVLNDGSMGLMFDAATRVTNTLGGNVELWVTGGRKKVNANDAEKKLAGRLELFRLWAETEGQ